MCSQQYQPPAKNGDPGQKVKMCGNLFGGGHCGQSNREAVHSTIVRTGPNPVKDACSGGGWTGNRYQRVDCPPLQSELGANDPTFSGVTWITMFSKGAQATQRGHANLVHVMGSMCRVQSTQGVQSKR